MKRFVFMLIAVFAGIGISIYYDLTRAPQAPTIAPIDRAALSPDWGAIAAWPGSGPEAAAVEAEPDPARITTLIILDDSTSMTRQMDAAKAAVTGAVAEFDPDSRVGVIALNAGTVLPVMPAAEAAGALPAELARIEANGNTPLGESLRAAAAVLTEEAQVQRGFGVFRILVTTDGAASDSERMNAVVAEILSKTPIELATIGLGIGEGHALNVPGFTSYVSVQNVSDLAGALTAAAAEQTVFQPVTEFEE